jgi:hypothetical protein
VGRTSADAPEIDGVVYVKPPFEPHKKLVVGQFVDVKITRPTRTTCGARRNKRINL